LSVLPLKHNSRLLGRLFSPLADGSLDGIIAQLTRDHGGNVHDFGIVDISSKSVHGSYLASNVADLQTTTYFWSVNAPDQRLCFDFKNRRVRPTHYSIHAHSSHFFLRSWTFEGSTDGSSWISLAEEKDNATMNATRPIGTFSVRESGEFRFIRLRQTGKNTCGDDYLLLFAFEIFGQLFEGQ
jgi:hypothetical protein